MNRRETSIFVRVSAEEKNALERAAAKEGRNLSDFVRVAAMIPRYVHWDATAMREIRRRIEDMIEERELELAARGKKRA